MFVNALSFLVIRGGSRRLLLRAIEKGGMGLNWGGGGGTGKACVLGSKGTSINGLHRNLSLI